MDPLDDLLESMEEAPPKGDDAEMRAVLQRTAAGLTDAWEDKAALKTRLRDLTQLLHIFLKAGKTLRLYADDHHFFNNFVGEFVERLYLQFETLDAVTFEVTPQSINWDGHVIFSNPEQRSNMAFKLYRDGIRLLQFRRGCTTDEVREFVTLVTRDMGRGVQAGEDLSILFWEADFKAIQIAVAETFVDYTDEAARVLKNIQEDLTALRRSFDLDMTEKGGQSDYQPLAYRGLDLTAQGGGDDARKEKSRRAADLDGDTALKIYRAGGDAGGAEDLISASPNNPYTPKLPLEIFDDAKMQSVYDDLQGIDSPFATFEDVGVVLATVIQAEEDPDQLSRLLDHLDDSVSPLLSSASLGPVNSILRRISLLERTAFPHKRFVRPQLRSFFEKICQSGRLSLLARAINTSWNEALVGELFTFISLQKRESVDELFRFLAQIEPPAPRRIITDAILLLVERKAEEFTPLTADTNTRLACEALYALGRIGDATTLSRICSAFDRPEPEVREAVLTTLRDFQSPRIHLLVLGALADPAATVRIAALRYITVYKIKGALQPIAENIRSRSFSSRGFDERRGWFIALGHLAGLAGLPALLNQAEPFRGGSEITEAAHLTLLGIKATRSREGKEWMETFAKDASGELELLTRKILAGRKEARS